MAVECVGSQIRVAILGLNPISESLIPLFQLSGFKVTCVWDSKLERVKEQCAKNGINIEELWDHYPLKWEDVLISPNVDLIYVATSPSLHAEITVKALAVGRHVVCQTPPASSVENAKRMLSMAEYYPKLFGGLNSFLRFLPAVKRMKDLLFEDNYCGRVRMVEAKIDADSLLKGSIYDWKCDSNAGGGVLNILGSHLIDLIIHLTESKVVDVSGFLNTFHEQTQLINGFRKITSDDYCSVQLRCSNGVYVMITVNCAFSKGFNLLLTVNGESGHLRLKDFDLFGCKVGQDVEELIHKESHHQSSTSGVRDKGLLSGYLKFFDLGCRGMLSWLHRTVSSVTSDSDSSLKEAIVFDQMDSTNVSMATFEDGLNIQRILSAALRSHLSRNWCAVNRDSDEDRGQLSGDPFWQSPHHGSLMSLENHNLLKPPHPQHPKRKKEARKTHSHS